ncbi:CHY zinc finger protein [Jeotgalibacillus alimentarius]|uniref:CHY zinc finger protein n=1 Tax=Jeotgalibacillus alimentarius TaxID=135826 RepID=UPI000596F1B9|nr:CHY zinc finger protein [Jeotgalibacillus alimentarius]
MKSTQIIHGHPVYGAVIDSETRCTHYHSEKDIIAIKFYCCGQYFPCVSCHDENGCGHRQVWPAERFSEKAILCGKCGIELTIDEYLQSNSACPSCNSAFNPGCSLHKHLYFETH